MQNLTPTWTTAKVPVHHMDHMLKQKVLFYVYYRGVLGDAPADKQCATHRREVWPLAREMRFAQRGLSSLLPEKRCTKRMCTETERAT
jgi:hypothetical protein